MHSRHARKFVEENLIDFAKRHPSVALYVVPETDMPPCVRVEFLNGHVENRLLDNCDNKEIIEILETYVGQSGLEVLPLKKNIHTDCPSIQGQWTPFMNKKLGLVKGLDFKAKKFDAWHHKDHIWQKLYRASEKPTPGEKTTLTYSERASMPLGKFGPTLKPRY